MPEPEQPETPRKDRSLTGFYIATAVFAALVGLGAWLWTPLRIAYWERQVQRYQGKVELLVKPGCVLRWRCSSSSDVKATDALEKLARVWPRSAPAFRRLLRNPTSNVRQITLVSFRRQHAAWALPLIVEASADQDPEVAGTAVLAAGVLTDQMWTFWKPDLLDEITPEDRKRLASEGRKNLLDWWEREGRAKYEGTGARP